MRRLLSIFLVVGVVIGISYCYINTLVKDAFIIDSSHGMTESAAPSLINTEQMYGFRLVNASDKKIKLLDIELQNYEGIKLSKITVDGKPFFSLLIPSHRVYSSKKSWSTNSQGVNVEYVSEIVKEKISNPQSVIITYSYLGLKHKQIIKMPGIVFR